MTADRMISLVEGYFAAVDAERLDDVLALLTPDCVFSVETHRIVLQGHTEISGMFARLWSNHRAVRHLGFAHVPDVKAGRIASQFQVENTEHDGSITQKSNCNFFDLDGDRFRRIAVYMAGENTLELGA